MKIAVCVKQVPESQSKRIDPATNSVSAVISVGNGASAAKCASGKEKERARTPGGRGEVVPPTHPG